MAIVLLDFIEGEGFVPYTDRGAKRKPMVSYCEFGENVHKENAHLCLFPFVIVSRLLG